MTDIDKAVAEFRAKRKAQISGFAPAPEDDYLNAAAYHYREGFKSGAEWQAQQPPWVKIEDMPEEWKDGNTYLDIYTGGAEFPSRHTDVRFRYQTDSEFWAADKPTEEKRFMDDLGYSYSLSEITHAMPLPQPPQESELGEVNS